MILFGRKRRFRADIKTTLIKRRTLADLPPIDDLVKLAQRTESLRIQVPTQATILADGGRLDPLQSEREQIVQELALCLPEHKVWDNRFLPDKASMPDLNRGVLGPVLHGVSGFSIYRTITEQTLEAHQELFMTVAADYRAVTNALMVRLVSQLGKDLSDFTSERYRHRQEPGRLPGKRVGTASGEWDYVFHSCDCAFTNTVTGMTVEARLGCGSECGNDFGILEPGFFLYFIATSAYYKREILPLARALRDHRYDMIAALEFMERRGLLRRLSSGGESWVIV